MKHIKIFIVLFCCCTLSAPAGDDDPGFVHGYSDFRNFLYVFENGIPRQLEQQEVRSYKANGSIIGYANSANDLIAYYKGQKFKLGDMTATSYNVTQSFMFYQRDKLLNVFQNGEVTQLTFFLMDMKVSDSLIAFRDGVVDILRVYKDGKVHDLEMSLVGQLQEYQVGENTVGYVNNTGFFKTYYDNQVYDLDNVAPESFDPGGNLVAYVDGLYNYLKIFYNKKILVLEQLLPQSYKAGVDVVAYIAADNSFKVFTNGKLLKVESYIPDFYNVRDRSVVFFFNNQFQLMLDGKRHILDEFLPKDYQMSENNIAWTDVNNRLHIFTEGKSWEVSLEVITGYQLNGNILKYDLPDGTSRIWHKGKIFGNN